MNRRTFISTAALALAAGCSERTPVVTQPTGTSSPSPSDSVSNRSTTETPTPRQTFEHPNGMHFTVGAAQLVGTLQLENGTIVHPADGNALLSVAVHATNTGDSLVDLPAAESFTLVSDGSQFQPIVPLESNQSDPAIELPFSGTLYRGVPNAHSTVEAAGRILFSVPRDTSSYQLLLSQEGSNEPLTKWTGSVDSSVLPNLEVQSIDAPTKHVNGESIDVSVTVENTGGGPGLFSEQLSVERSTTERTQGETLNGTVDPGETVTLDYSLSARATQDITVSLPSHSGQEITVVPATKQFGEFYTMDNGLQIRVDEPIFSDGVTIDKYSPTVDKARDNYTFATFVITLRNQTRSKGSIPDGFQFDAEANDYIDESPNRGFFAGLKRPVEMEYFMDIFTVAPGHRTEGVLYFSLPGETVTSDVTARGTFPIIGDGHETCEWLHSSVQ